MSLRAVLNVRFNKTALLVEVGVQGVPAGIWLARVVVVVTPFALKTCKAWLGNDKW